MTKPLNQSKRLKVLEATVQEQEATILHLRTENSVLLAKLAAKRRRKPVTKSIMDFDPGNRKSRGFIRG